MSKKIKPAPALSPKRGDELLRCEKELLDLFHSHHVTLPEAIFLFEKIKFSSMHYALFPAELKTGLAPRDPSMYR